MQTGRARKCGAFNAAGERPKPLKITVLSVIRGGRYHNGKNHKQAFY